ncbi:hypothetical protein ACF0H5_011675 [Mactra antiquata]
MRWLDDGNRLSVHNLKEVVEPKIPLDDYKCGMRGLSKYRGYPGLWQFRILNVGGKQEMKKWLDDNISSLTNDVSDMFCEDMKTTDQGKKSSPQEEHQVENSGQLLKQNCDKTMGMESSPPSLSVVKKCGQGNQTYPILIEDHKAESSGLSLKKSHDAHEQCKKSSSPLSKTHQVEQSSPYLTQCQDKPAFEEKYVTPKLLAEQSLSKTTQQDGKVHSQCVSRKEFRELKDEVRRLKRKLVSLTEPSSTESEQKATSTSSVLKSPQSSSSSSADESETYNGFTLHDLKDSICHTDKLDG